MEAPVKAPRVEVITVKRQESGSLRAIATIRVGPLYIHGCRLIQQAGQHPWASPPQSEWKDSTGKTRYRSMLEWPKEWGPAVTDAIEEALADHPGGIQQMEARTDFGREVLHRAGREGRPQ